MKRYAVIVIALLLAGCSGAPSSEDVVLAFEEAGLEVGDHYPLEQDEVWQALPHPENYKEGTRFEISSLGQEAGGRVFAFESEEDLETMRSFYADMAQTGVISHLYTDGLVLLQINGDLPKVEADRYGEVLREEV